MVATYTFHSHDTPGEFGGRVIKVCTSCHHLRGRTCQKINQVCPAMQRMEQAWLTGKVLCFGGTMNDDGCGFLNGKTH